MIPKAYFAFFTLFMTVLVGLAPCRPGSNMGGTIETGILNSISVGHDVNVSVYLPENYSTTEEPYRLFIFLHGAGGDTPTRNINLMRPVLDDLIGSQTIDPMVVVWPRVVWPGIDGNNYLNIHQYTNSERNGKYQDVITVDLVNWIEARYHVSPAREKRAMGGFSMGAEASVRIVIRNSEDFIAFAAHDGAIAFEALVTEVPYLLAEYTSSAPGPYFYYPEAGFYSTYFFGMAGTYSPAMENSADIYCQLWKVKFPLDEWGNFIPEIFDDIWKANHDPATLLQDSSVYKQPVAMYFDTRTGSGSSKYFTDHFHLELDSLNIPHTYVVFDDNSGHRLKADAIQNALLFLDKTMDAATTNVRFAEAGIFPVEFQLDQNYPNPFNASTTISFHLDKTDHVVLVITNALGETIDTPVNRLLSKGDHRVTWDASDQPGGLYFYTIKTAGKQMTKKLVIVR